MMKLIKIIVTLGCLLGVATGLHAAATCNASIAASTPSAEFTDHNNGTVTHNRTGLMWQRCAQAQTWSAGTCTGSASGLTWSGALQAAVSSTTGGYSDWRLPNIKELQSLVEERCYNPSINDSIFPNTPASGFWSASAVASDSSYAWIVYFDGGYAGNDGDKGNGSQVRLVRAGQSFASFDSLNPGAPPVCSPSASPASISAGGSSTLTANCPTATSYSWTGGTCAGITTPTCTVTPASTTTYYVTGTNSGVSGTAASVTVTVTPPLSGIPASERQVLLNIYNSTNGASWNNRTNWLGAVGTECTWIGVGCNAALNHVEVLSLSPNNLTGTLPSINGLVALRQIDFSGNQLTGQIPSLSGLSGLQGIWVGYNQLTGTLPSFSGLAALQAISAPYNQLTGSIPLLSDQAVLQSFNVNNNRLTGPVPAAPSSLSTGSNDLCGNSLVSSGNPAIDIAWQNATMRNWLACQTVTSLISQTISFTNPGARTLGAAPFALSATGGASGNAVTFTSQTTGVCTVSGSTVTLVVAGTCTVAADQAGNASYAAATQVLQSFAVTAPAFSIIDHYYQNILNRPADAGGKAYWQSEATRMSNQGVSNSEAYVVMAKYFFSSPEFLARGFSDDQFVRNLYLTFFNRGADQGGLDYWKSVLTSGLPRDMVMYAFMFSPEFSSFMIQNVGLTYQRAEVGAVVDYYRGAFGRLPDDGGLKYWVNQFRSAQCSGNPTGNVYATAVSIAGSFFGGPDYWAVPPTPSKYDSDLYNAFMRRGADLAGFNHWVNQISTGTQSYDAVRKSFIDSTEFGARVQAIAGQACTGMMP